MADLKPRNTQTRVKHEILSRYLDTWGGIIVNGLRNSRAVERRFVYVDCFSSLGKYAGEKEDTYSHHSSEVDGSPFIGIKALDRLVDHAQRMGVNIRVNTVLIEREKKTYEGLLDFLARDGYGQRIRKNTQFRSLDPGQIAVVNADCTTLANDLLLYTGQDDTWSFYLIDPHGPSGIPYPFVKRIVSQARHDVMINFIFEDLLRKIGMCIKENLTSSEQLLVDYWSGAFGGTWWIDLAKDILLNEERTRTIRMALDGIPMSDMEEGTPWTDEELAELKEQTFVSAYRGVLKTMDPTLITKLVNLRFWDKERTMFYLFLTTHDVTGALQLNRILSDAKYLEHELRYRLKVAKKTAPPPGQMSMFSTSLDEVKIPELEKTQRPTTQLIAIEIMKHFSGKKATRKDVYKAMANTLLFPEEIDKGITHLRRENLAEFEGKLQHKTLITFSLHAH